VKEVFGDNGEMLSKLSIIEGDGDNKMVRMANLAIVGSFKVRHLLAIFFSVLKVNVSIPLSMCLAVLSVGMSVCLYFTNARFLHVFAFVWQLLIRKLAFVSFLVSISA
jgi:hypothetical protein